LNQLWKIKWRHLAHHRQSFVSVDGLNRAICRDMAETTAIVHRQERQWMASSSGLRSATERRTYWTHVQLTCKMLILCTCFVVVSVFCSVIWCNKRTNCWPFVTHYAYCHLLDGATLFYKTDSNKLRFNVKNEMTLICAKFDEDLISISEVTSHKTKWPRLTRLNAKRQTDWVQMFGYRSTDPQIRRWSNYRLGKIASGKTVKWIYKSNPCM